MAGFCRPLTRNCIFFFNALEQSVGKVRNNAGLGKSLADHDYVIPSFLLLTAFLVLWLDSTG
jgi:hypothetical protein